MAERSSADVNIKITDATGTEGAGGSLATLTGVLTINGVSVQEMTEESYAIGDDFSFMDPVGISRVGDISISMFLDDTPSTGNYAILANRTRTLQIQYGGTTPNILQQKLDVVISAVNIQITKGQKTKLEVTLQPHGDLATAWV
jgi:hypothetical protein